MGIRKGSMVILNPKIVKQVKPAYILKGVVKNTLLKAYKHRVQDLPESFDAINIQAIPLTD